MTKISAGRKDLISSYNCQVIYSIEEASQGRNLVEEPEATDMKDCCLLVCSPHTNLLP